MEPQATALINDPMALFAFLAGLVALVFWLSELPALRKLFEVVPPVIYVYFLPMLATTAGITPAASPLYKWTVPYLLLFALLLLMVSVDIRSILKLGGMALFMVAAGTLGIIIGGPVSLLIFQGSLPADAWTGFAALSGSWIGGTANMVAIAVIVVDTVVGYGWMGVLIALVGFQHRYDRRTRARTGAVEETNRRLESQAGERRAMTLRDAILMIGTGMACSVLAAWAGGKLPAMGDPTIISSTTWAVLIVVTGGLLLSFTPARQLEEAGASNLGYTALYRPARARAPLLRRHREHGQHRRRGLGAGRRGGLPPGDGPGRAPYGRCGVYTGDIRGAGLRLAARAGGGVKTLPGHPTPAGSGTGRLPTRRRSVDKTARADID